MKIAFFIWSLWSLVATFYAAHEIDDRLAAHYQAKGMALTVEELADVMPDVGGRP